MREYGEGSGARRLAFAVSRRWLLEYTGEPQNKISVSDASVAVGASYLEEMLLDPSTSQKNIRGLIALNLRLEQHAFPSHGMDKSEFETTTGIISRACINAQQENIPFYYQSIIDECKTAAGIASEEGVDACKMFEDDALYAKVVRKRYIPDTFAQRDLGDLGRFLEKAPQELLEAFCLIYGVGIADPSFQSLKKYVNVTLSEYEKQSKRVTRDKIKKFWGQTGLDSLSADLKEALGYVSPRRKMLIMGDTTLEQIREQMGDRVFDNVDLVTDQEEIGRIIREWRLDKTGSYPSPIIIYPHEQRDRRAQNN